MLSRAASSLFWMARYLERAESQARLLDVSLTMALIDVPEDRIEQLSVPLLVSGTREMFFEYYNEVTPQNLIDFLVLDDRHPASVYTMIRSARDNALHVRGNLSADVWESINQAWFEMKELRQRGVSESNASTVFDWVRERSHMFRGAAYGTLLRNDAFHFLRLGTFLERADTTARVLDIRYVMAMKAMEEHPTQSFFEWTAVLHSLAAFEAYQNTYGHNLDPMNVAELLILEPDVPRSLRGCLQEIASLLEEIESDTARRSRRLASSLYANIRYGDREYIAERGLHEYLVDFLERIQGIAGQIRNDFMGWKQ
ncbi:alpha-E domain-containing protein [Marinobacter sp. M216]|uniref:Alpha-E domain-containing protein n=1 Tax=Marinobacter albus TaxID=3030833 RepID=A0ABT7HE53_9GAMM|nr:MULTISPECIES: alpha-E domain-containing protein [unclassified Marinobacter]MBW7472074.1 alpha-E domain-containing protein [Marinobacter sp. F4218]MDK9558644.1 alpha-E domain-containing protein [Marinobacter sp. M216]